jgi:hypothetical protein
MLWCQLKNSGYRQGRFIGASRICVHQCASDFICGKKFFCPADMDVSGQLEMALTPGKEFILSRKFSRITLDRYDIGEPWGVGR